MSTKIADRSKAMDRTLDKGLLAGRLFSPRAAIAAQNIIKNPIRVQFHPGAADSGMRLLRTLRLAK